MKNNAEYIKNWIAAAGVRAVKTVAQTAVATIGTAAVLGAVDWRMVAGGRAKPAHQRGGAAGGGAPAGCKRNGIRRTRREYAEPAGGWLPCRRHRALRALPGRRKKHGNRNDIGHSAHRA